MSEMISAVAGTMADLGLILDEAEPAVPNSADAAAPEAHETAPAFAYDVTLPEDLEELLDAPEGLEPEEEHQIVERYQDEDQDELARRLARSERQLTYERDQRLKVSRKAWLAEGEKFFPLADLETINADSRRAFLREARSRHQRTFQLLKPRLDEIERIKQTAREEALAEERARVAGAYGRPTVGVGGPPPPSTQQERLDASRQKRDLRAGVRALIESGQV